MVTVDLGTGVCRFEVYMAKAPYSRPVKPPHDKWYRFCPKSGIAPKGWTELIR